MPYRSVVQTSRDAEYAPYDRDKGRLRTATTSSSYTVDRLVAGVALLAFLPVLAMLAMFAKLRVGKVLEEQRRLGHNGREIVVRRFAADLPGRRLPHLFSVVNGDLRLIGPPTDPFHNAAHSTPGHGRQVVPGLMSAHRLRNRTGIAYDDEPEHQEQSPLTRANIGLMMRCCIAELLHGGNRPTPEHVTLDGVHIYNTTMRETLYWSIARARERRTSLLCFVNADCLNQAVSNQAYRDVLRHADRVVGDGIGVRLAARFGGHQMRENVNGTDLFPQLCQAAVDAGVSLFLLGARPGVAAAAAEEMERRYPGLQIAGHHHGYLTPDEEPGLIARINESGAGILLVAMGAPAQEQWIDRHRDDLRVGLALGVGGLFDFYSGRLPRAPQWVREMGLEWVWRLAHEPGRMWRRYLVGNPRFLMRTWWAARGPRPRATAVPDVVPGVAPGVVPGVDLSGQPETTEPSAQESRRTGLRRAAAPASPRVRPGAGSSTRRPQHAQRERRAAGESATSGPSRDSI